MLDNVSIWALKKLPMDQIIDFISERGDPAIQARMAGMPVADYSALPAEEAKERILTAITQMNEETYDDFLLEIIDE